MARGKKGKVDSNFLQVYKGVAIKEGLNFSAVLGALIYKYNYWNYKAPDYLYQQYIANDDYFYITEIDMTEESLISPKAYNKELVRMEEIKLIDKIKERGKPIRIKVDIQAVYKFIKDADNFYISYQRKNKEVRKKYKKYKQSVKQPNLKKIKLLVEKFQNDMKNNINDETEIADIINELLQ